MLLLRSVCICASVSNGWHICWDKLWSVVCPWWSYGPSRHAFCYNSPLIRSLSSAASAELWDGAAFMPTCDCSDRDVIDEEVVDDLWELQNHTEPLWLRQAFLPHSMWCSWWCQWLLTPLAVTESCLPLPFLKFTVSSLLYFIYLLFEDLFKKILKYPQTNMLDKYTW